MRGVIGVKVGWTMRSDTDFNRDAGDFIKDMRGGFNVWGLGF